MGEVEPVFFDGSLPASKSLMNRALIVQSFFPEFKIHGSSSSADVIHLENSLREFKNKKNNFDCGAGGTSYRFLLSRLSREPGEYHIKVSQRLLERPQSDLYSVLEKLGTKINKISETGVQVQSTGWGNVESIFVSLEKSSQFLSSLLLSSWNLENPIRFEMSDVKNSYSYLKMTMALLRHFGMEIEKKKNALIVAQAQRLRTHEYLVEQDVSSSFALGALALTRGQIVLRNLAQRSLQPDIAWVSFIETLGGNIKFEGDNLLVKTSELHGGAIDLSNTPDLFPVLAVLLSRAQGESILKGLKVLRYKESNRLQKTCELLNKLGLSFKLDGPCLRIKGTLSHNYPPIFEFDPDQDHRLAMAAGLAIYQGASIKVLNRCVVDKSFPEFWDLTGL